LGEVLGGGEGDTQRRLALADMRRLETELFGAVGRDGAMGARVLLKPPVGGKVLEMEDHKVPRQGSGLRYMSYGVFDKGRDAPPVVTGLVTDDPRDGERPIGLSVGLLLRSGDTGPQRAALCGALGAVLWLWGNLGGLGARSRRGWGGVELLPEGELPEEWEGLFPAERPASRGAALNALNQGLDRAVQKIKAFALAFDARPAPRPLPELRTTAGIQALRAIPEEHGSGRDAIEHAGTMFLRFRSSLERAKRQQPPLADYKVVRGAAESGQVSGPVGRAAFGLPLNFRFPSLGGRVVEVNPIPPRGARAPRGPRVDRMPSSLLFRVVRLADQGAKRRFFMLLVYLEEGRAPLGGCGLTVAVKGGPTLSAPNPGDKVVMDFLNLAVKPGGGQ
jgi:CRISPR-associated protein Cmr1